MDRVYGSRGHDWLLVHGGLTTLGRPGRSGAQEVVAIARREREEVVGFSPMMSLRGVVAEMATRRRSTETACGAPMGSWFQARGGIGAGVGAVDNVGALVTLFIGS
jgi:hypothetical protein